MKERDPRICDWMCSASGLRLFPDEPDPATISIEDMAHALSLVNRYGGHTYAPYSVAQHSVYVSRLCHPQDAPWGLLHDGPEYVLGDVASPVKRLISGYADLERAHMAAIAKRFRLPGVSIPESVKHADRVMLATEGRDLLPQTEAVRTWWGALPAPVSWRVVPVSPEEARNMFMDRYAELFR